MRQQLIAQSVTEHTRVHTGEVRPKSNTCPLHGVDFVFHPAMREDRVSELFKKKKKTSC